MQRPTQTVGTIACCLCGAPTPADAVADGTCMACLSVTTNIASAIEPSLEVEMCRTCGKWYRNPQWVAYEAESAELLAMCVRRVRGLRGLHLVDASWIWTEPHSRRLKVKLTVRKEVLSGTALCCSAVVEFVVRTRNCDGCNKVAAKDLWSAKVQLRQRAEHPRTLLAMEQVIRRQRLAAGAGVRRTREGPARNRIRVGTSSAAARQRRQNKAFHGHVSQICMSSGGEATGEVRRSSR